MGFSMEDSCGLTLCFCSAGGLMGPVRMISSGHELTTDYDEKTLHELGFKDMQVRVQILPFPFGEFGRFKRLLMGSFVRRK